MATTEECVRAPLPVSPSAASEPPGTLKRSLSRIVLSEGTGSDTLKPDTFAKPTSLRRSHRSTCSNLTFDLSHSTSLAHQLTSFKSGRMAQRRSRHRGVLVLGGTLIAFGVILLSVDLAVLIARASVLYVWAVVILRPVGVLMVASGILVETTCPLDNFDLDEPTMHLQLRAFVCAIFALTCLAAGSVPPHAEILGLGPTAWGACARRRVPPFTSLLVAALIFLSLGDAVRQCYLALYGEAADGPIPPQHRFMLAGVQVLVTALGAGCWRLVLRHLQRSHAGNPAMVSFTGAIYGYQMITGTSSLWAGTLMLHFDREDTLFGLGELLVGSATLLPQCLVVVVGRARLFTCFARCLGQPWNPDDHERVDREQDGAFIAAMLDDVVIAKGRSWWLHRDAPCEDYTENDHRRNWQKGVIVEVRAGTFVVEVEGARLERPLASRNATADDLLSAARSSLKCLDWRDLTPEVLMGNLETTNGLTSTTTRVTGRPVQEGEPIDFFISHSWQDDADAKFQQLTATAEAFVQAHGREPTFWLDHVCIDQDRIGDGLKALPVNIMACDGFIALCGPSYLTRLWCAWELCTLMAFKSMDAVLASVQFLALEEGPAESLLQHFYTFDIAAAACYDPNEQARVLTVVHAFGAGRFNGLVRRFGRELSKAHRKAGMDMTRATLSMGSESGMLTRASTRSGRDSLRSWTRSLTR